MTNLTSFQALFLIMVVLSIALDLFLSKYLLYRYDHNNQLAESGE